MDCHNLRNEDFYYLIFAKIRIKRQYNDLLVFWTPNFKIKM